jgi:hypothetical protein
MVVMPITAYHLLTIIYSLYFNKIFQLLCILHLFYLITLLLHSKSSHLYRVAAYAVWQNHYFSSSSIPTINHLANVYPVYVPREATALESLSIAHYYLFYIAVGVQWIMAIVAH